MREDRIIEFLRKKFPISIGDDGAFFKFLKAKGCVITKDLLIEDVHFRKRYFDALDLAHKSLHVNLSDLVAMGAKPRYVLLGLSIPKNYGPYIDEFLKNFCALCKKENIQLIGGDTTLSTHKLFISITALGEAEHRFLRFRHGSKHSDVIYVAGSLGYAHIGFKCLEKNKKGFHFFKKTFKRPRAKILEGLWLGKRKEVRAMIDLSDGLFVDLLRLCKASNLKAEVNLDFFKAHPQFKKACQSLRLNPLETMLTGGEDYGLLFSVQKKYVQKIEENFFLKFKYKLQKIGEMQKGSGVQFTKNGVRENLKLKGFSHFGENISRRL